MVGHPANLAVAESLKEFYRKNKLRIIIMSEYSSLPFAVSHKELNSLLKNARKDEHQPPNTSSLHSKEKEDFEHLLSNWSSLSEDLIKAISKKKDSLFNNKGSNSLLALGALDAHLKMAIQAHRAYEKEN